MSNTESIDSELTLATATPAKYHIILKQCIVFLNSNISTWKSLYLNISSEGQTRLMSLALSSISGNFPTSPPRIRGRRQAERPGCRDAGSHGSRTPASLRSMWGSRFAVHLLCVRCATWGQMIIYHSSGLIFLCHPLVLLTSLQTSVRTINSF